MKTTNRKTADGRKLYRLASFQKNQHKFDYWYTKALLKRYDAWDTGEGVDEAED